MSDQRFSLDWQKSKEQPQQQGLRRLPPLEDRPRQQLGSMSPSFNSMPSLPPPPPFRMHSYHQQPSVGSSQTLSPPSRRDDPLRWPINRSPSLNRDLDTSNNMGGSFSRFLPPPPGHSFPAAPLPSIDPSMWRQSPNDSQGPASPESRDYTDAASASSRKSPNPSYFPPLPSEPRPPRMGGGGSEETSSTVSGPSEENVPVPRKVAKAHVPSACLNCKRAHLACDVGRPCRRCINLGKSDTCIDVQHKKRGRPRLKDRENSQASLSANKDAKADALRASTSPSSSHFRRSPQSDVSYFRSPPPRHYEPLSPESSRISASYPVTHTLASEPLHGRSASGSFSSSMSQPVTRPEFFRTMSQTSSVMQSPSMTASSFNRSAVITMICSTNLQCARVSEECLALLGFYPSEMLERSLFELVHPSEANRLEELWSSLIDPVGVVPQAVPAPVEVVMSTPPARLMAPAAGTIYAEEKMRLRQRNGIYDFYSVRLHLGGGFGVDLYRRETLDRAYIVASLLKLGNDATHPDPAALRFPYQNDVNSHGKCNEFWSPVQNQVAPTEAVELSRLSGLPTTSPGAGQHSLSPNAQRVEESPFKTGQPGPSSPFKGGGVRAGTFESVESNQSCEGRGDLRLPPLASVRNAEAGQPLQQLRRSPEQRQLTFPADTTITTGTTVLGKRRSEEMSESPFETERFKEEGSSNGLPSSSYLISERGDSEGDKDLPNHRAPRSSPSTRVTLPYPGRGSPNGMEKSPIAIRPSCSSEFTHVRSSSRTNEAVASNRSPISKGGRRSPSLTFRSVLNSTSSRANSRDGIAC
ncbi:hypothetical protein IE53DRAFT_275251 [Violaceomyces palustris]|uniref:Uncharacterized protein n=1 Tax=Violaceomyces palustris TaxID=1673888 RepID=A0ACD0NMM9_9BASI|nr:hypothetical protein IE53DRAFT_275251 [Violaceomyces palustris]